MPLFVSRLSSLAISYNRRNMQNLAVITGASAGIGAEFARQLAAQGYDLLLTARRADRLEALAHEIGNRWGTSAEIHPADLADHDATLALAHKIESLPNLTLLVNNAGFGIEVPIAEAPIEGQLAMIHVHTIAPYLLCRAALQTMLPRKQGGIINVSSVATWTHGVGAANYCATKAYLTSFSQSLSDEVGKQGVTVQALCPGYTETEFHDTPTMDAFDRAEVPAKMWDSAEFVVKTSLEKLNSGQIIVIPGRKNQALAAAAQNPLLSKLITAADRVLRRR